MEKFIFGQNTRFFVTGKVSEQLLVFLCYKHVIKSLSIIYPQVIHFLGITPESLDFTGFSKI